VAGTGGVDRRLHPAGRDRAGPTRAHCRPAGHARRQPVLLGADLKLAVDVRQRGRAGVAVRRPLLGRIDRRRAPGRGGRRGARHRRRAGAVHHRVRAQARVAGLPAVRPRTIAVAAVPRPWGPHSLADRGQPDPAGAGLAAATGPGVGFELRPARRGHLRPRARLADRRLDRPARPRGTHAGTDLADPARDAPVGRVRGPDPAVPGAARR